MGSKDGLGGGEKIPRREGQLSLPHTFRAYGYTRTLYCCYTASQSANEKIDITYYYDINLKK